jgi:hypothetical protein
MKIKLLFVAALAAVLAVVGSVVMMRATFTQATPSTMPVQPFYTHITSALDSTVLGTTGAAGTAGLHFKIDVPQGTRQTLPTFYSNRFPLRPDKDIPDDVTVTGGVIADVDIFCDGGVDLLAQNDKPNYSPYTFYERTTNVDTDGQLGTDEEDYVRFNSPLWEMVARLRADLAGLWIGGEGGFFFPLPTSLPLNSTQMQVPWMPDTHAGQVALGGDPGPPNGVCQDSPQNSESTEIGVMDNPPIAGDSGEPCLTCVDKGITMWSAYPASLTGPSATTTVTKKVFNYGPAAGAFTDQWVAEPPDVVNNTTGAAGPDGNPDVSITWTPVGSDTVDGNVLTVPEASLAVDTGAAYTRTITVTCEAAGNYRALVALKNILLPTGAQDQNLLNNAATTMIQIDCGDVSGQTSVDKSVIWVKPTALSGVDPANPNSTDESTPDHLQLVVNDTVTVTVDELKVYHPHESDDASVDGRETLEVEAPAGVAVNWVEHTSPSGHDTTADTCTTDGVVVPCTNTDVNDLEFTVAEPAGQQLDEERDLEIKCTSTAGTWPQPLVIKAIDVPIPPFKEDVKHDNVTFHVIPVWCYASDTAVGAAADGIDDGTGLYIRWTAFQSNADVRMSYSAATAPPTGSPGDTAYTERMIQPECFFIDANGADDGGDGWVTALESQADPDIALLDGVAGGGPTYAQIDPDGDCLINAAYAQPGQPVDSNDTAPGMCAPIVYSNSAGAIQVVNSIAADQDCDGLTDGVEVGWGSDPKLTDTDGDGSSDFLEMFEFTNPRDPDTDNDGIKDKPEDDYVAAPVGGNEMNQGSPPVAEAVNADDNCPTKPNPGQENNDGQRLANGAGISGSYSSNPNQDTLGDACDTDDDNDAMSDVAELKYMSQGGTCTLNPVDSDYDNDHCVDGNEIQMGKNACTANPRLSSLDLGQTRLFRGGGINVPTNTEYGGAWAAQNDLDNTDQREKNADADYSGSPPSAANSVNSKGDGGADADNDDGSNGNPAEIADIVEVCGFNTGPSKVDSDGDGCPDWVEIADVNGDRQANITDVYVVAGMCVGGKPAVEPDRTIVDLNKDTQLNITDVYLEAKNSSLVRSGASCLPTTTDTYR